MKRRAKDRRAKAGPPVDAGRWATYTVAALLLVTPLVFSDGIKNNFRLPKELVAEVLVLISLCLLGMRLVREPRRDLLRLARHPAFLAVAPLLAVAGCGLWTAARPDHVRSGLASLAIGAAALVGWSLGFSPAARRQLLRLLIVPATLLSLLAVAQFHDIWNPFQFAGTVSRRLGTTAFAGGAFDLAAYLVLPLLRIQLDAYRTRRPAVRALLVLSGALCLYAMALTQTLTALLAVAAASFVLWLVLVPPRRVVVVAALLAVLGVGLGWGLPPLHQRLERVAGPLAKGDLNRLLTGRLDAWRAAAWMLDKNPWTGIGQGAFSSEFAAAKLSLLDDRVDFFGEHRNPHFSTAHNEILEVAAECGWLGLAALGWGLAVMGKRLAQRLRHARPVSEEGAVEGDDIAFEAAGLSGLTVLALTSFPLHLALVAYPHLLLLSGVLAVPHDQEARRDGKGKLRPVGGLVLTALLIGVTILTLRANLGQLQASRIVLEAERLLQQGAAEGRLPSRLGDEHLRRLRRAQDLDPALVDVPVARGSLYLSLGRPHGARRAFEHALALEPRAEVYRGLGQIYFRDGDPGAAREALDKAVRLDPSVWGRLTPELQAVLDGRGAR